MSPKINATSSSPINVSPITKACANPLGTSWTAYSNLHPNCEPSPSNFLNAGKSCGVEIIKICELLKINYFIGSEFNVLERFYKASKKFNAKHIVRLTADCPMHDPQIIDHVIKIYKNNDYDYVSNVLKRTYPDGLDVEVFNFESLEAAFQNANEDLDREHVTTYLRNKISLIKNRKYKKYNVENQKDLSSLRWTLDNQDDLNKIKIFFKYLPENFSWKEAIKFESEKKFKFENEQL